MIRRKRRWVLAWWPLATLIVTLNVHSVNATPTKTRLVSTKYGQMQGSIRHLGDLLGDVEVFKGIPYASPPIEDGRFTPTNTPTPWEGIFDATISPPVCPQLLPELDNGEQMMPKQRVEFIRKILPALANQSEDCLTLNIFAPIMVVPGSEVYPVLVFFHGESFSWGAGSLYDGSILSAYGRIVIVTINYRLGPLGFLNTYGGGSGVVSNFALLDQITALSWIGENIGQFGGDSNRVTLFGRDTGAACISHLAQSPIVPPGLFQRAVLLSGGAWCPWAQVASPLSITIRLAVSLNCPVPKDPGEPNPHTVECLRNVPLASLMEAAQNVTAPTFTPTWGPSEDGVVVAKGRHSPPASQQSRTRIDWIVGITPKESWSWLAEKMLTEGVSVDDFEKVVRSWVRNNKKHHLREIMAVAVQEYTDWTVASSDPLSRRDLLLDLLSDAGTVAPLLQGVETLMEYGKVFFFICDLSSQLHDQMQQPGWELSLLFGAGLSDVVESLGTPGPPLPGPALAQLSEDVITLLTNFAKSGDPNLPRESPSPGFAAVAWPRYTKKDRKYLTIGVPPSIGSGYRAHQLALWSWLVPELEAAGAHSPIESDSWEISSDDSLFYGVIRQSDPWYFLQPTTSTTIEPPTVMRGIYAAPAAVATSSNRLTPRVTTTFALLPTMGRNEIVYSQQLPSTTGGDYVKYSTALLVTIGLGVSLLLLNGLIFLLLFWRRSGSNQSNHRCEGSHHGIESVMSIPRVGSMMSMGGNLGGGMMPIGGSFGGPPDCIKSSYDKLHLTAEELQRLASSCRSPPSSVKRSKSPPEPLKVPQAFQTMPNVVPIKSCQRSRETSFTLDATFRNLDTGGHRNVEVEEECRIRNCGSTVSSLSRRPSTPGMLCRRIYDTSPFDTNNTQILSVDTASDRGGGTCEDPPSETHSLPQETLLINPPGGGMVIGPILDLSRLPPIQPSNCPGLQDDFNIKELKSNGWATFIAPIKGDVPNPPPPPRISTLRRDKKVTIVEEAVHRL